MPSEGNELWKTWSMKDGLKESYSSSVTVSRDNNTVWINHSHSEQMTVFDGYEFEHIEIPDAFVQIHEGENGQIWTQLYDDNVINIIGFQQWNFDHWMTFPFVSIDGFNVSSVPRGKNYHGILWREYLFRIYPWKTDRILYVLKDQIGLFDATTNSSKALLRKSDVQMGEFIDLDRMQDGALWILCEKGIVIVNDPLTLPDTLSSCEQFILPNEMEYKYLFRPLEVKAGEVYFTARKIVDEDTIPTSIIRFDRKLEQWELVYEYPEKQQMYAGWRRDDDTTWALSTKQLRIVNPINNQEELVRDVFPPNAFHLDVELGSNDSFWIASKSGITRYSPYANLFEPIPNAYESNTSSYYAMYKDSKNRMWYLTHNGLLLYSKGTWKAYELDDKYNEFNEDGYFLYELQDGRIFVYSSLANDNILLFNPQDEKYELYPLGEGNQLGIAVPYKDGTVWVQLLYDSKICDYAIGLFDGRSIEPFLDKGTEWNITELKTIYADREGRVWFGGKGDSKIAVLEKSVYNSRIYPSDSKPSINGISCFYERDDGVLLAGGEGQLFFYENNEWRINDLDAPPFGVLYTMHQTQNGDLWLAAELGLLHYHDGNWILHNETDGLPKNVIYNMLHEDENDRFWIGTQSGLYYYQTLADIYPPNSYVPPDSNFRVFSDSNEVLFRVYGIDKWHKTDASDLFYSHKVDQGDWSEFTNEQTIKVPDVSTGDHIFYLRTMDRNFNIDRSFAEFPFRVKFPWYLEWGFLIVSFISLGIIGFLGILHIRHYIYLGKTVIEKSIELNRTNQHILSISEREQQRIGHELHDGIVQDLAAIAMSTEMIAETLNKEENQSAKELEDIVQLIDESTAQVRRLSRGLSPVNLDKIGLINAIQQIAANVKQVYHIPCKFDYVYDHPIDDLNIKMNAYRIVQEATNNAGKYSKASCIQILLRRDEQTLTLHMEDDGVGFDTSKPGKGMGVHIMKYRANIIQGQIVIDSEIDRGTQITCTIPIKKKDQVVKSI
jgi:signal transduction histidine kinase